MTIRLRWVLSCVLLAIAAVPNANAQWSKVHEAVVELPGTSIDRIRGELILPGDGPLNAVIVLVARGLSTSAFENRHWRDRCRQLGCAMLHVEISSAQGPSTPFDQQVIRNAAMGGDRGLFSLLESLAVVTGREELRYAPLVFWGFSAAGSFGVTFAVSHPQRTAAVIRYHSNMREILVDFDRIKSIPMLIVAGENDAVAGVADSEAFWTAGRARKAPWSFILDAATKHMPAPDNFQLGLEVQIAWLTGVLGGSVTK